MPQRSCSSPDSKNVLVSAFAGKDLVFRAYGAIAEINRVWRHDRAAFAPLPGDSVSELRALVGACRFEVPDELPPVLACLVGYFGYETYGLIERLARPPANPLDLPDMLFVRPALVLIFDRLSDELFAVAPVWPSSAPPEVALAAAQDRIDEALRRLAAPAVTELTDATLPEPVLTPTMAPGRYGEMVLRAKDYIAAGDIFQVVLAQRFTCPFTLPPLSLYRALRRVNPSPFLYFLDLPGFALTGSSPEILVRVRGGRGGIRPSRPDAGFPRPRRAGGHQHVGAGQVGRAGEEEAAGGLAVESEEKGQIGDYVAAYVDHLGEGFRMPSGVRKPPKHEPAGMRQRSMGISAFGRAR